jgi:predicted dehydrogenase
MGAEKLRTGLAGAGFIAATHCRALRQIGETDLVAVCDPEPGKAASFAKKWGIAQAYGSLAEMVERARPSVVHVLSPPPLHVALAIECIELGCHAIVEKPLGVSVEECSRLVEAAAARDRFVAVNHNSVYHPAFQKVLAAVRARTLGQIRHVVCVFNMPLRQLTAGMHGHWMFTRPENIVLELAAHPLAQITRLMGDVRKAMVMVSGERTLRDGRKIYDTWQIALQCRRGTAQLFLSYGKEWTESTISVIGQDGAAHADLTRNLMRVTDKTRFSEPVDQLLQSRRQSRAMAGQGRANVLNYVLSFLGLRPFGDNFAIGIHASLSACYAKMSAGQPPEENAERGLAVVAACELLAAEAAGYLASAGQDR